VASAVLTEDELTRWGERVGSEARPATVIALRGDLGAGKTTFARAVARGAGVEGPIPSPTYNLLFRYSPGDLDVVHIDLYRLEREDEVWALGWGDLPGPRDLVLIEWPERAGSLLPEPRWEVHFEEGEGVDVRRIRLEPIGAPPPVPPPGQGR
jgi:tRNA threonylcarbamoyladenosine biosynthesis protein TsaE